AVKSVTIPLYVWKKNTESERMEYDQGKDCPHQRAGQKIPHRSGPHRSRKGRAGRPAPGVHRRDEAEPAQPAGQCRIHPRRGRAAPGVRPEKSEELKTAGAPTAKQTPAKAKSPYNHWSTGFCYAIIKR